jgi:hypothetical protein
MTSAAHRLRITGLRYQRNEETVLKLRALILVTVTLAEEAGSSPHLSGSGPHSFPASGAASPATLIHTARSQLKEVNIMHAETKTKQNKKEER